MARESLPACLLARQPAHRCREDDDTESRRNEATLSSRKTKERAAVARPPSPLFRLYHSLSLSLPLLPALLTNDLSTFLPLPCRVLLYLHLIRSSCLSL